MQVFVEYVMLAGVNDGADQAHQLGQLLQGRDMIINLIPWNPVYSPDISFEAPASSSLAKFQHIVRKDYGLPCTIRQEKGQDISGLRCLFCCHNLDTHAMSCELDNDAKCSLKGHIPGSMLTSFKNKLGDCMRRLCAQDRWKMLREMGNANAHRLSKLLFVVPSRAFCKSQVTCSESLLSWHGFAVDLLRACSNTSLCRFRPSVMSTDTDANNARYVYKGCCLS